MIRFDMVMISLTKKQTKIFITVSSMIWLFLSVLTVSLIPCHGNDTVILHSIEKSFSDNVFTLQFKFNNSPLYFSYWLEEENALFLDLIGSNIIAVDNQKINIDLPGIATAEPYFYKGYEPAGGQPGKVDGIKIYMDRNAKYEIVHQDTMINLRFANLKQAAVDKSVDKPLDMPISFSFKPEQQAGPSSDEEWQEAIWGWRPWLEMGAENYGALKIAKSQYELAQLKLREAKRQLFPNAIIRVTNTDGATVGDVGIFSSSYELELEQPVTYGGELRYKIDQAEINRELSLYEHKRLYADYALELKRSYYNVILNRMNWDVFNKLLVEANKILALGELMYQKELITDLEYKQLTSSYQQVKFFFISSQKELSLAELSFRQLLGVSKDEELSLVNWLPFQKVNVDLDKAVELAKSGRPELRIRQLVSQFNKLNEQITKAQNRFRVSLTGKTGKMAEGYKEEDEVYRTSWYLGLKVTKPLGSSTWSSSVSKQSRPVGDFSLEDTTDSLTKTMELSLIDRLGLISDMKTAETEYLKALNEELESEKTIAAEVEKSYANYISSLFQIETSLQKLSFLDNRLKVTEGKMKIEEADITSLMQAYLDQANEMINYGRSLIGYYIALASMAKACGVESYLNLATDKPVVMAWERFSAHVPNKAGYTPFALPGFRQERPQALATGIAGRIIGVNNQYGMAILNIGDVKGLTPNSKVVVYRNGKEYAFLVPAKIGKDTSACYLERGVSEGFKGLRIGDDVEILQ
ncbi:MAG: TolC family protein [Candidatus Omnitrophica bacterium]|nr:TolC family protein [Candidatus Omnitrophota bacterium]